MLGILHVIVSLLLLFYFRNSWNCTKRKEEIEVLQNQMLLTIISLLASFVTCDDSQRMFVLLLSIVRMIYLWNVWKDPGHSIIYSFKYEGTWYKTYEWCPTIKLQARLDQLKTSSSMVISVLNGRITDEEFEAFIAPISTPKEQEV